MVKLYKIVCNTEILYKLDSNIGLHISPYKFQISMKFMNKCESKFNTLLKKKEENCVIKKKIDKPGVL